MPLIALLVAPVLACFVGGIMAAAARPIPQHAMRPEWPDNVIHLDRFRNRT